MTRADPEAGACGDFCGKCPNFPGSCRGCVPEDHQECHFVACCGPKGLEHCGLCPQFPCERLVAFVPDDRESRPRGYHIEALKERTRIGTKAWLEQQRRRWGPA